MAERERLPRLKNDKSLKRLVKTVNAIIEEVSPAQPNLTTINLLQYTGAWLLSSKLAPKTGVKKMVKRTGVPPWKQRLQRQIEDLRGDVSIITEYLNNNNNKKKLQRKLNRIIKKHKIPSNGKKDLTAAKEYLKQRIQAKAQRVRRYSKRTEQYRQNKIFKEDAKKFYRSLGKKNIEVEKPPDAEENKQFWQNILEEEVIHNENAEWIKDQEGELNDLEEMEWKEITISELKANITKAANWKSPGPDKVPNFWLKQFTSLHENLTKAISDVLANPEQAPEWLVKGNTTLLPKKEETWVPKNYRPIACLPTTFKILTSIITDRLYDHLEKQAIMAKEQRGGKRDSYGCKDQLMINNAILDNCKIRRKNLTMAWIDYRKAYDSIPHSWILKVMNMYKVHPMVRGFIESSMSKWKTNMTLVHKEGTLETGPISIKRGIFQGDSLSPLLFTMSMNPLSKELQKTGYGYKLDDQTTINHLFYVDDLKLYGRNDSQMNGLLKTVKMFSDDIHMEFGLDKCAKATFKPGKKVQSEGIHLAEDCVIQELEPEGLYQYLGIEEGDGVEHQKMKKRLQKEYKRRIKLVLKSELNARNKIKAINTLAVPVVTYSYGIITWRLAEIQDLDRMTRKQLCIHRMHARKADVERIYLPCQEGGRGLTNLEREYKASIIGLWKYISEKDDIQIKAVLRHHQEKSLYSIPKEAKKYLQEAGTEDDINDQPQDTATKKAKKLKQKYKRDAIKVIKDRWKEKPMHGKFPKHLGKENIDKEQSFQWMKYSGLKGETEGLLAAAQDQALNTRYYSKHISKQGVNDICRMCHIQPETVEHIVSGCTMLAADQYLNRHNQVAAQLHMDICKHYDLQVNAKHWYEHKPERVTENNKVTILWDSPIATDRHIPCNKPDIVIKEKDTDKCVMIDVAIPSDYNIQKKATEKMNKYVDLQIECQRMWNKKIEVIPIVIGATGVVEKNLTKYLSRIPGKHNIYNLQRSAILGTAHILRKTLSIHAM